MYFKFSFTSFILIVGMYVPLFQCPSKTPTDFSKNNIKNYVLKFNSHSKKRKIPRRYWFNSQTKRKVLVSNKLQKFGSWGSLQILLKIPGNNNPKQRWKSEKTTCSKPNLEGGGTLCCHLGMRKVQTMLSQLKDHWKTVCASLTIFLSLSFKIIYFV